MTDIELEAAIEKARNHKMTAREKFEQRVSFVYGQQDHDKPGKTKDEVRQMLADSGGWPLSEMDELTALRARVAELEGALGDIARQRLTSEMDGEQAEHADYEGAYDIIVGIARAALQGDKE